MRIAIVVGARPNFMKAAPIVRALERRGHDDWLLVHTGQHYDAAMSDVFFNELHLPKPDVWLGVGSGSHATQTARIVEGFDEVCRDRSPDCVVVVGDVNSTMAAALAAAKRNIPVAHVEAGLRSGDRTMPEEINRLVTDVVSDILFTPSADAVENLLREGIASEKIQLVGNVMVDSLLEHLPAARQGDTLARLKLCDERGQPRRYAVVTLHRPANVDVPETLDRLMRAIEHVSAAVPVIFPVHPRTAERLRGRSSNADVRVMAPLGYLDFLALTSNAALVLTDSGGLQEETTVLGVPCLTLRENTERPITVTMGTNHIVGTSTDRIIEASARALADRVESNPIPPLWDGRAAERIVNVLLNDLPSRAGVQRRTVTPGDSAEER